jgi:hypothetical protein
LDELVKSAALPAGAMSLPPNELDDLGINIVELNSAGYFLSGHPAACSLGETIANNLTPIYNRKYSI